MFLWKFDEGKFGTSRKLSWHVSDIRRKYMEENDQNSGKNEEI